MRPGIFKERRNICRHYFLQKFGGQATSVLRENWHKNWLAQFFFFRKLFQNKKKFCNDYELKVFLKSVEQINSKLIFHFLWLFFILKILKAGECIHFFILCSYVVVDNIKKKQLIISSFCHLFSIMLLEVD